MVMRRDKDPLVGALPGPTANTTGSPALAGQPPSITGAQGAFPEMPRTSSPGGPGPALAPAPAPGGTADVGGAPLSIDGAQEQAAGAGGQFANFDLVKDRGTPDQYWQETLNKTGSQNALAMMGDAANAASHRTGQQAEMDPETVRRDGVRVNEAMGMGNDPALQDANIEGIVYTPMAQLLKQERDTGTIDSDEADFRMMTAQANVEGPQSEDELREIFIDATRRMSDVEEIEPAEPVMEQAEAEDPTEEIEEYEAEALDGDPAVQEPEVGEGETDDTQNQVPEEKKNLWERFKSWWKRGTEDEEVQVWVDPETGEEVEAGTEGAVQETRTVAAEDVEVTKFMGGMTRQELGMFVFQWGAMMMANAEEGFGGAMGIASLGAMQGHQQRALDATAAGMEERALAAQELTAQAAMTRAQQGTQPKTVVVEDGVMYFDQSMNDGAGGYRYIMDPDTNERVPPPPNAAGRPYAAQALQTQLEASGFFTPEDIAILISQQPGRGDIRSNALTAWERRMSQEIYPDGMRKSDWRALPESERERRRSQFIDQYVNEYMKAYEPVGALPSGNGAGTAGGGDNRTGREAVDEYDEDE